MKTQLLKKLIFVFALFAVTSVSAQNFTFDSDLEGFTENFGPNGTVEWDADGGAGALKLTRSTNNANFGRSDGAGLDAAATPIIKIRIKNLTAAKNVRIGGRAADGTTTGNKDFNNILTAEDGNYATFYLDMASGGTPAWFNGVLTNFWVSIRGNIGTDSDAAYITQIEFLATAPPSSLSGIVQNASLDDFDGSISPFSPAAQTYATVILSDEDPRTGTHGLKHEYSSADAATQFVFNNYIHGPFASTSDFMIGSVWVKVVRPSTPGVSPLIDIQGQGRFGTTLVVSELVTKSDLKTTTQTDGEWEQVSFAFTPDVPYTTAQFRYGIGGANLQAGDIVYVDDLHAELTATLNIKENTLTGVSIYPNPASGLVNVSSLNGGDIAIYNILGARVLTDKATSKNHQLNVSSLTSGLYILKVVSDNKSSTKKIIIN